jgi:endonuclease/exonuclease/phosphatase family metal-dependent hydrolase
MKFLLLPIVLLLAENCQPNLPLRFMTYNIRLDYEGDGVNHWPKRKDKLARLIQQQGPDVFGVQEAKHNQMQDLTTLLPAYESYGLGRDDGKLAGEFSAVFYKKEKFDLLQSGTFWLSETPAVPGSKSWDAAITRVCSWAQFSERKSGYRFFAFNTHFDHIGEVARLKSMELISQKVGEIAGGSPFILMGDFNFEPSALPYQVTTDTSRWQLKDSYLAAEKNLAERPCTFTGFKVEGAECRRIDYVFASPHWQVKTNAIIHENDGVYFPSDHLPVVADVLLPGTANR